MEELFGLEFIDENIYTMSLKNFNESMSIMNSFDFIGTKSECIVYIRENIKEHNIYGPLINCLKEKK